MEATIIVPLTGQVMVYSPLVADTAAQAITPLPVPLPVGAVVGLWFGTNANMLTLLNDVATGTSLTTGNCVFGVPNSMFGAFAYCNAMNFFTAATAAVTAGFIKLPPIQATLHGAPCPTSRSFTLVDQAQSDGVLTQYIVTSTAKVAQNTANNRNTQPVLVLISNIHNGADNRLLNAFVQPACQCNSFTAPDLLEPTVQRNSLALNELQASLINQATIPSLDPMVLTNGMPDLVKLNAYRAGLNQAPVAALNGGQDTVAYCTGLAAAGPFLSMHATELTASPSPMPLLANNLMNYLALRLVNTWQALRCGAVTPVAVTLDANGVVTANNAAVMYPTTGMVMVQLNSPITLATGAIIIAATLVLGIIVSIVWYRIRKSSADM